jgi:uncharacterized membrane protein YdbT with pleckstrin-like domain
MCSAMKASDGEAVIYSGHPSWKSMLDLHIAGLFAAAAGGAIARLVTSNTGYAVAIFAAILAVTLLVGYVRRISTHYEITDRRLHIKRGIVSRIEQQTTIDRVMNVETRQSLWERVLRIGTVDFDTSATDQSQFSFVGVATPKRVVTAVDRAHEFASAGHTEVPEPL